MTMTRIMVSTIDHTVNKNADLPHRSSPGMQARIGVDVGGTFTIKPGDERGTIVRLTSPITKR
jgi:hypothetical protein